MAGTIDYKATEANDGGLVSASGQLDESEGNTAEAVSGSPVEGSQSGTVAPRVEMTDIGLVDLNSADMSVPTLEEDDGTLGARVADADGNLL